MYIKRDIENIFLKISKEYSAILLIGSRQVGKSTMLAHIAKNRELVSLDDFENRNLAKTDPKMFLEIHKPPIIIDEIQYAPELFSYIKIAISNGAKPGSFWLTGSQNFKLMKLAGETLAGRVAILHMTGLSQNELYRQNKNIQFSLSIETLKKKIIKNTTPLSIYSDILNGSMPALRSKKYSDKKLFYSSYLQTYIERDIKDVLDVTNHYEFLNFIRSCAARDAQILNIHSIATDVGISDDTAKRWLSVLEMTDIIFYLYPYSNNLLKRTIKKPKLYFYDTGLVTYLTKYNDVDTLFNGAMNGAILENFVISEIVKSYINIGDEPNFYYYRDKENNEIDLIISDNGKIIPIEIKKSQNADKNMIKSFDILKKNTNIVSQGAIINLSNEIGAIDSDNLIIPVSAI